MCWKPDLQCGSVGKWWNLQEMGPHKKPFGSHSLLASPGTTLCRYLLTLSLCLWPPAQGWVSVDPHLPGLARKGTHILEIPAHGTGAIKKHLPRSSSFGGLIFSGGRRVARSWIDGKLAKHRDRSPLNVLPGSWGPPSGWHRG
jgi:hypothetical protein